VFSRFEEDGVFNANTGQHFRDSALIRRSSQPATRFSEDFRERTPTIDALLRQSGLSVKTPAAPVIIDYKFCANLPCENLQPSTR